MNEQFYLDNAGLLATNSIALSAVKMMGWGCVRGLVWCADKCKGLYDISFGMIDFTSWTGVNEFVDKFRALFIALMALSILALGIILILNHEKKPKIIINICVAVLCVTCSTVVFSQLNTITKDLKEGIESVSVSGYKFSGVYDVVKDNLIDIVFLDQKVGMKNINFKKDGFDMAKRAVNKDTFALIDYTEVMNPKSSFEYNKDGDAEKILKKRLVSWYNGNGTLNTELRDVYTGFGWNSTDDADFTNEFYYRYKFDFFPAMLQLISIIVLYVALSYKCIRIIFELVVARLLAYLYSAELSGGQKMAKILVFIRDSYILLLVTTLCIRLFYMMNAFLAEQNLNSFVQGVLTLFVAFCVIDGPNLVEKLLGMDAGLKSSTARLLAAGTVIGGGIKLATAPGKMATKMAVNSHERSKMGETLGKQMQNSAGDNKGDKMAGTLGKDKDSQSQMEEGTKGGKDSSLVANAGKDNMQGPGTENDSKANSGLEALNENASAVAGRASFMEGSESLSGSDKGAMNESRFSSGSDFMNQQKQGENAGSFKEQKSGYKGEFFNNKKGGK
ncbi:MAG: pLS20_p028 family conjugation system transmembrane protein [Anaerovoracaceae bacterium]